MCKTTEECSLILTDCYFFKAALKKLGLKGNCIGYFYILEVLKILINDGKEVHSFSREVYPIVAEKYKRGDITVERDIRTCISKQWDNIKDKLTDIWNSEELPSCRQFIFILKRYIMKQIT